MLYSLVLSSFLTAVAGIDFMGLDVAQGCADYLNAFDPKINALLPKIEGVEQASVGTSVEAQSKEAGDVGRQALSLFNADRKKNASDLVADKAAGEQDFARGKKAMASVFAASDATPDLTRAVKDLNTTMDGVKAYGRGALRPCARDLNTLRAGFKDVGAPQARVALVFDSMMGLE